MRLRWTEAAVDELTEIVRYIRRDNPKAGRHVAKTIYDGCESLIHSPYRGRIGKHAGTRELIFNPLPYIAVYRVLETVVEILHIHHGERNR